MLPEINYETSIKQDGLGLIGKTILTLFNMLDKFNESGTRQNYRVYLSMFQIYNEQVFDLLEIGSSKVFAGVDFKDKKLDWKSDDRFEIQSLL